MSNQMTITQISKANDNGTVTVKPKVKSRPQCKCGTQRQMQIPQPTNSAISTRMLTAKVKPMSNAKLEEMAPQVVALGGVPADYNVINRRRLHAAPHCLIDIRLQCHRRRRLEAAPHCLSDSGLQCHRRALAPSRATLSERQRTAMSSTGTG